MNKAATLTHSPNWAVGPGKPATVESFITSQLFGLVQLAKSEGLPFATFADLTGDVLRAEISAPSKEGYATEAEGLTELFTAEGGCVDVNAARSLYRKPSPVTRQRIGELIRDGELVAYRSGTGEYSIPVWQFKRGGGVYAGVKEALQSLKKAETFEMITPFAFFLQEDPMTDGVTPLQALRDGSQDKVIAAAKHFAG